MSMAAREPANDFIPRVWATRKVGYLLDEIRLRGENPEIRESVVQLARRFGIVTPYTSYLVTEESAPAPEQPVMDVPMSQTIQTGRRHGSVNDLVNRRAQAPRPRPRLRAALPTATATTSAPSSRSTAPAPAGG
ncbi:MAG: hypothetical protein IPF99_11705 [Deltaproteobacteria bacterium]|nr:hypothetical protein [Deltaproteobacteria bacterium]